MSKLSREFKVAMTTLVEYFERDDVKQTLGDELNKYVDSVNNVKSYMTTLEKKSKKKEKKESEGSGEEKPKKKLTSYFLFMKDTRPGVAKSNPEFSVTEISKELGRMWKELSDEEKAEWKEKAQNQ